MKSFFENKITKIVFGTIKALLIVVIVVYLSFILVQRLSGNKSIMGYRIFTVATGSMIGVYDIDDVIAVKDCDTNSLKVGDDIAYKGNRGGFENRLITHRIIDIEKNENGGKIFHTKGVNSNVEDPTITDEQILGKVVGKVPVITRINHVVKSQVGFFLLLFCPLVLVIVLEILHTITNIKLERHELVEIKTADKSEVKDDNQIIKDKEKKEVEEII